MLFGNEIQFHNLQFLWMLWLIPLVIAFVIWATKRKQYLIDAFVSPELKDRLLSGVSFERQRLKIALFVLGIVFCILALIRPKYGFHWEEVHRRGVDILVALDVSKSMLAEDVLPNRLERAKREIIDLLKLAEGDRIGLIAFAGASFLQCPLTLDYGAVQIFLDDLDTNLIPVPGTAIAEAIGKAQQAFNTNDDHGKALILITDGEDHQGAPVEAAKKIAEKNVRIYAIGIGKEGGAPIPDEKTGGFKKNSRGELILSKLDEQTLQEIALATGGSYVRSTTGDLDFARIYSDIKAKMEDKDLLSGQRKRFEERFQWPLFLAIILFFVEMLLSERAGPRRGLRDLLSRKKTTTLLILGLIGVLGRGSDLFAFSFNSSARVGAKAYEKGDYKESLQNFLAAQVEDPTNLSIKYNLANVYHQLGDYEKAQGLYEEVLKGNDAQLRNKALYNLGNNAYREGKLDEAVKHFEQALAADPSNEDAKANLEFVREEIKRRLEEQKKRQQQQKNQGGQNKPDDQKQQGDQQGDQKQDSEDSQKKDEKQNGQQQEQPEKPSEQKEEGQDKEGQDGGQKEQDKKEDAQDNKPESKPGEKEGGGEEKNEENKSESGAGQEGTKAKGAQSGREMSEDEALRWLSNIEDDARKEHMQKQMKASKTYRTEKDW